MMLYPPFRTLARFAEHGAEAASVGTPSDELGAWLAARGLSLPVYYDVRSEARWALEQWAFPNYLVLDGRGRIRFQSFSPGLDLVRRVHALGG